MSFMLFYTDFVGEGLYEGVPSALPGSVSKQRYDEGQIPLFTLRAYDVRFMSCIFINVFVALDSMALPKKVLNAQIADYRCSLC